MRNKFWPFAHARISTYLTERKSEEHAIIISSVESLALWRQPVQHGYHA